MNDRRRGFWLRPNGLAAMVLIGGVLYFLLAEHRAHFIAALPFLIVLACPLLHVFMHRNHHGHGDDGHPTDHADRAGSHRQRERRP